MSGRPSLRTVLVVSFVTLVAFAVCITGWTVHASSRRTVGKLAERLNQEVASRIEADLRGCLDAPHLVNAQNAQWIGSEGMLDDGVLVHQFARQVRTLDAVSFIQVGREADGGSVGVERSEDGVLSVEMTDRPRTGKGVFRLGPHDEPQLPRVTFVAGYDARARPWYRSARGSDRATWSPVYELSSRASVRLGITAVLPIRDPAGRLLGVAGADIVLSHLSSLLRTPSLGESARAVLVERDGMLIASSSTPIYEVRADQVAVRARWDDLDDPLLRAAVTDLGPLAALDARRTIHTPEGWITATPILDGRGLDWVLVSAIPPDELLSEIRQGERRALVLALVVVLVAGGVGGWVAARNTESLRELAEAATRFARGELDAPLPSARVAEVDALVRAFDAMRTSLRATLADSDHARELAEAGSRAKSAFLASISHELRTPLNAIVGYTDLLAETLYEDPDPVAAERDLARIRGSGLHLLALIGDLLDLARLESGRLDLHLEPVVIGLLLQETIGAVRPAVEVRGNVLELMIESGIGSVVADQARLRQVLINLLGNAGKFTDHGLVELRALRAGDWVRIEVRDSGIGIAPERLAAVFEPFTRSPGAAGREGAGLGLAIVRHLVEAMGGTVSVSSEVGRGSVFAVRLPVHDAGRSTVSAAPPAIEAPISTEPP